MLVAESKMVQAKDFNEKIPIWYWDPFLEGAPLAPF